MQKKSEQNYPENITKEIVIEIQNYFKIIKALLNRNELTSVSSILQSVCPKQIKIDPAKKCAGFFLKYTKNKTAPIEEPCLCFKMTNSLKELNLDLSYFMELIKFWPLKKGSVAQSYLAWNQELDLQSLGQSALAIFIKIASYFYPKMIQENTDNDLKNQEKFIHIIKSVFYNDKFKFIFWNQIKSNLSWQEKNDVKLSRSDIYSSLIPKKGILILSLESTIFSIKIGDNSKLSLFESFIDDVYNSGSALIICALQPLSSSSKGINKFSFKVERENIKTSLESILLPKQHIRENENYKNAVKSGCYDKLIECLSMGQNFLDSL